MSLMRTFDQPSLARDTVPPNDGRPCAGECLPKLAECAWV
jgi:hypothetical protein